MMEQLSLENFDVAISEEEKLVSELKKCINNIDYVKYIKVNRNNDDSISIKAKNALVAKVKTNSKKNFVELRAKYSSQFANTRYEEVSNSLGEWIRIPIESFDDVITMKYELSIVCVLVLAEFGGESFGCCSRYEKCSEAKKCIHPDNVFSSACSYKKNLEQGRIFYGNNKNV